MMNGQDTETNVSGMKERSAAQLLLLQFEADIVNAKQDLTALARQAGPSSPQVADMIENLADLCCKRWWIRRIANRAPNLPETPELAARSQKRLHVYANITEIAKRQSGPMTPDTTQLVFLAVSAKVDALWNLMLELGLESPEGVHTRLDAATDDLYARATQHAAKVIVPEGRIRSS